MKQLISAGFDSVFEISESFRNMGVDNYHIPEFPMLEVYKAFVDVDYMLDLNLELIEKILIEYNSEPYIDVDESTRFRVTKADWMKVNAHAFLKDKIGVDILTDIKELRIQLRAKGLNCADSSGPATIIGSLIDRYIRAVSKSPIIITHLPATMTPLMKKNKKDQRFAERYWLFLNGVDISDIGGEQVDYDEQYQELYSQYEMMREAHPHIAVNTDILKVVSYGLPETGGIGFSLSRLLMAIENLDDVRETPIFPYI